jgi:hypothetical protein
VDEQIGFVTKSVAAVPLLNTHTEVIGCTEMLNREGGADDTSRLTHGMG